MPEPNESRRLSSAQLFGLFFLLLLAAHLSCLRLPYFWDEAGYYIPAARDLFLTGSLIPHSTPSNAHPPLVLAFLALAWRIAGPSLLVTRVSMLLIAAFSLLGVFRLARRVANFEVALASTICTAIYPVFFTQSSLAQIDLAAAGLIFWGLSAYVENRPWHAALWFSVGVMAKETALLAPLGLFAWDFVASLHIFAKRFGQGPGAKSWLGRSSLLLPVVPLALWYAFHYSQTGFVFGNPEFFRYNVQTTLQPLRILLAFGLRLWQLLGYLNLYLLTLSALAAMWLPPIGNGDGERRRIETGTQFAFLAVTLTYLTAMSFVGGAVLARYMLPVVPLIIMVCISTLRRRVHAWRWIVAIVALAFVAALFVNPPYGLSLEDNFAYRDYILLHEHAENYLAAHYPNARVLTAWPASDELSRPYLGYLAQPIKIVRIEDFAAEQVMSAVDSRARFEAALVFSTKYEPPNPWFERWQSWQRWKAQFFGYHRDVPPAAAAKILGGRIVYEDRRDGQWVAVIEVEQRQDSVIEVIFRDPTKQPSNRTNAFLSLPTLLFRVANAARRARLR